MQVNCKPPGGLAIRLIQYRPTLGGYLKLAVLDVGGSGGLTAVGVRSSSDVSAPRTHPDENVCWTG